MRSTSRTLSAFILPGLLLVAGTAHATTGQSMAALAQGLDPLFQSAATYMDKLVPAGMVFLSIALVLELFSVFTRFFIKGGASDLIAELVRVMLVTSIPLAMLTTWPSLPLALFHGFTDEISHVLTGTTGGSMDQISHVISNLYDKVGNTFLNSPDASGNIVVRAILDAVITMVMFIPFTMFTVALLFALFGPVLMLYVGVIIGPILVPWMVWKPMESFGMKWLSYMVTMGLAFVIGILMAMIVTGAIGTYLETVFTLGGADGTMAMLVGILPTIIMMLFGGYMMMKCENIAAALVGGPSMGHGAAFAMAAYGSLKGAGKNGGSKSTSTSEKGSTSAGSGSSGESEGGGGDAKSSGGSGLSKQASEASGAGGASGAPGAADLSKQSGEASGGGSGDTGKATTGGTGSSTTSGTGSSAAGGSAAGSKIGAAIRGMKMGSMESVSPVKKALLVGGAAAVNPALGAAVGAFAVSKGVRNKAAQVGRGAAAVGGAMKEGVGKLMPSKKPEGSDDGPEGGEA